MNKQNHLQCPACGANFGAKSRCTGCGADLSRLMDIAARSLRLRQQTRQALRRHQYSEAYQLSTQAQDLHETSVGRTLLLTAQIMNAVHIRFKH
jgi:hypothetical protein